MSLNSHSFIHRFAVSVFSIAVVNTPNLVFQVLYVCLGTPAGYVSARIYKSKFLSNVKYYRLICINLNLVVSVLKEAFLEFTYVTICLRLSINIVFQYFEYYSVYLVCDYLNSGCTANWN